MKTTKKHKTINKSRLIIFIITFVYHIAVGIYLKDFLAIAPTLTVFYLLSILSTLFLLIDTRSTGCRTIIYIVLFFTLLMGLFYAVACQRPLGIMTFILAATEMLYFALYGGCCRKDMKQPNASAGS